MRIAYRYIRPLTVLYARGIGPYATSSVQAWLQMNAWLDALQMRPRVKQAYGLHHDDPKLTAPELLRYDACVPATAGLDTETGSGIGRQTFQGGAYAVHTYVGSYTGLGRLYAQLHAEIVPKRGLSVDYDRPFVAIYLNDPAVTREVHRRTELCVPVLPVQMSVASDTPGISSLEAHAAALAAHSRSR